MVELSFILSLANGNMEPVRNVRLMTVLLVSLRSPQAPLLDPNLPSANPEALQTPFGRSGPATDHAGQPSALQRPVRVPISDKDSNGRSCKGRHETIEALPEPVCYPNQVTNGMLSYWRQRHP